MTDDDDEIDNQWSTDVSKKPLTPKKSKSPALVVDNKNRTSYRAFETKDKPIGFVVRCHAIHYTFFYHHLLTIALDSPSEDFFTLITSNAVIQVYGERLQAVAAAFGMHGCTAITEFSPEIHLPLTDDSEPYIEKIDVKLPTPKKEGKVAKVEEEAR